MAPKTTDISSVRASVELPTRPEDQELARKLGEQSEIEAHLADFELQYASLHAELASFERQYLHFVGSRYAELDELKAQLAEKIALARPGDQSVRTLAAEARARSNESKSAAGEETATIPEKFDPSPDAKRLYREVAKRIHPDLASEQNDRVQRQRLMSEANQAYGHGDEARLIRILTEYEHRPEAVPGDDAGAELIRAIRRISQSRSRMAEIEAGIQELMRSDLYQLKVRVALAEQNGHEILREMTEKVEAQIAQAKRHLESSAHDDV